MFLCRVVNGLQVSAVMGNPIAPPQSKITAQHLELFTSFGIGWLAAGDAVQAFPQRQTVSRAI
jgi:hypothetical protein